MIALLLEYPFNIDAFSYQLPMPENIGTNELCLLTFNDLEEYDNYLNAICSIIDELEYSSFFSHNIHKAEKLIFCKSFIEILVNAKILTS